MKSNNQLIGLIQELRKKASTENSKLYRRIADDLSKTVQSKRIVNLTRLAKHTQKGDFIVVPGKVLGGGDLSHELTVAAFSFSDSSVKKIEGQKGKCLNLTQFLKEKIDGKKIKIIG